VALLPAKHEGFVQTQACTATSHHQPGCTRHGTARAACVPNQGHVSCPAAHSAALMLWYNAAMPSNCNHQTRCCMVNQATLSRPPCRSLCCLDGDALELQACFAGAGVLGEAVQPCAALGKWGRWRCGCVALSALIWQLMASAAAAQRHIAVVNTCACCQRDMVASRLLLQQVMVSA
jgi:hypothetical protein